MENEILIHVGKNQCRVALVEQKELVQIFFESGKYTNIIGNIYLAKVCKVMSGIYAAFVDINENKDAFFSFF